MISNRRFDITDHEHLAYWIACCMGDRKAIGWRVVSELNGNPTLVFFWCVPFGGEADQINALPVKAGATMVSSMVEAWLSGLPNDAFGAQPGHDGSNVRAFRLHCEQWGHVGGQWEAFMAASPVWGMVGK